MRAACEKGGSGAFDGFSADVFSLGVVLYALLVGQYPWSDTHASDTVRRSPTKDRLPHPPTARLPLCQSVSPRNGPPPSVRAPLLPSL